MTQRPQLVISPPWCAEVLKADGSLFTCHVSAMTIVVSPVPRLKEFDVFLFVFFGFWFLVLRPLCKSRLSCISHTFWDPPRQPVTVRQQLATATPFFSFVTNSVCIVHKFTSVKGID